jgi:hypothetical protein
MSTWAVLAAKRAVIATGFGTRLVPAIGPGSPAGLVIGAGMTALTAPGRPGRRASPIAVADTGVTEVTAVTAAAPVTGARSLSTRTRARADGADRTPAAQLRRYFLAAEQFEPNFLAAEQFEPTWNRQVPAAGPAPDLGDSRPDRHGDNRARDGQGVSGYQSRHRIGDGSPIRRPRQEGRRTAPKHAAPSSSFASRMTGMFARRAVLSAARR